MSDGSELVSTTVLLPSGWNKPETIVRFVLPTAYPSAQPDCFFADVGLRLADGAMPTNAGFQSLDGREMLWFSWHLSSWSPAVDNVKTYVRFIERRFHDAR